MNEIKEYKFDEDFSFYTQKTHEIIEVPRFIKDFKDNKTKNTLINSYKEYFTFHNLTYKNKILLENNIFDLIGFNNILKLFSNNNLDTRIEYNIDELIITVNQESIPYKLQILNHNNNNIHLNAFECFNLSTKIQKMLIMIEPIPYSNKL